MNSLWRIQFFNITLHIGATISKASILEFAHACSCEHTPACTHRFPHVVDCDEDRDAYYKWVGNRYSMDTLDDSRSGRKEQESCKIPFWLPED